MRKTRTFAKTICYTRKTLHSLRPGIIEHEGKTIYRHALRPGVYARCCTDFAGQETQQICLIGHHIDIDERSLKGAAPALFGAE